MSQTSQLGIAQHNAKALYDAGDPAAARQLLADAIEAARPAYGEDHPELLGTAHLLAKLHRQADDPAAARRVLEEAHAAGQRRWGDADPLMLAIAFDLGTVAEELGNRHEARRNFTRVATAGPAVLGDDHWTVRTARDYLDASSPPPLHPSVAQTPPTFGVPTQPTSVVPTQPAPAVAAPPPPVAPVSPSPAVPLPPLANRPTSQAHHQPHRQPSPTPVGPSSAYSVGEPPQPVPPSATTNPGVAGRGYGVIIVVSMAAVAAVLAAIVVVAVALADGQRLAPGSDTGPAGKASTQPAPIDDPPTALKLRDDSASITITWSDPTAGAVPFVVAGGRAGQTLGAMATVDPGTTSYTVNGLNSHLDYCFTVLAVYSTDRYATSGQVCTDRGRSPTPR